MPEKHLHKSYVDPCFQQVRGRCVAEHVGGDGALDARMLREAMERFADVGGRERFSGDGGEKVFGGGSAKVAGVGVVTHEVTDVIVGEEDSTLAVSLADDGDGPLLNVDVGEGDTDQFTDAHTCGV